MHDMETHSSPHIMGRVKHIHFIGIGGIGMSGIAELMLDVGYKVQGSDIALNQNIKRLSKKNIN